MEEGDAMNYDLLNQDKRICDKCGQEVKTDLLTEQLLASKIPPRCAACGKQLILTIQGQGIVYTAGGIVCSECYEQDKYYRNEKK